MGFTNYLMSRMAYITKSDPRATAADKIPMLKPGQPVRMWQVKQGGMGSCYLYDAIQMVARWGFLREPGLSETGVYKVTIFDPTLELWRPLFLDDRFPASTRYDNGMLGKLSAGGLYVDVAAITTGDVVLVGEHHNLSFLHSGQGIFFARAVLL